MLSVNKIRLRRSGILKTFAMASKNFIFDYLNLSPCSRAGLPLTIQRPILRALQPRASARGSILRLTPNHGSTPAGLLNLLQGRFRKHVRRNRDLARQFARSQNLQPRAQLLDHTQLQQTAGIELVAFQLLQTAHIHDGVFFPENVGETALRQAPVQRHLAAFKPAHDAIAGNGPGALRATAGILAAAGAHALPDPLPLLFLPSRWLEIPQIPIFNPLRSP